MTDIVETAGATAFLLAQTDPDHPCVAVLRDCADEIERLRQALSENRYDTVATAQDKRIAELEAALADKDMMMAAANEAIEKNLNRISELEAEVAILKRHYKMPTPITQYEVEKLLGCFKDTAE